MLKNKCLKPLNEKWAYYSFFDWYRRDDHKYAKYSAFHTSSICTVTDGNDQKMTQSVIHTMLLITRQTSK